MPSPIFTRIQTEQDLLLDNLKGQFFSGLYHSTHSMLMIAAHSKVPPGRVFATACAAHLDCLFAMMQGLPDSDAIALLKTLSDKTDEFIMSKNKAEKNV